MKKEWTDRVYNYIKRKLGTYITIKPKKYNMRKIF